MSYIIAMFPDNRIRELRTKAGLSQTQLGELVGLHQTQIGKLENSGRNLTFEWARRIAKALNVTLADLLDDSDNPYRLDEEEQGLVTDYRRASREQQHMVKRIAAPLDTNDNAEPGQRGRA